MLERVARDAGQVHQRVSPQPSRPASLRVPARAGPRLPDAPRSAGRSARTGDPGPMTSGLDVRLAAAIDGMRRDGVYKTLNHLDGPQSAWVEMEGRGRVLILSSNNYAGLCDVPELIEAGKAALDRFGAGTGSVRFICGTFTIHRELEAALARFVGTEAALSYASCWTANEGLMPTFLDAEDV